MAQLIKKPPSGWEPWVGKIPSRRAWEPTLVFLPGESYGQRSLVCCSPWGHKESLSEPLREPDNRIACDFIALLSGVAFATSDKTYYTMQHKNLQRNSCTPRCSCRAAQGGITCHDYSISEIKNYLVQYIKTWYFGG